ncbi:MAG: Rrf2 family transcriptional regulator [Verrucomicrobia bacterium]|nr:Rrf2 family transcriptional regulator [Verrucomicrobiota bacterium]
MQLSVKSDYAARAVLGLAAHFHEDACMRVEDLAAEQGIPANYLTQILIELKGGQIVRSQRGKIGGYRLARPPAEITLGEVLRSVHGRVFDTPALTDGRCPIELKEAWRKLQQALDETSDAITFQTLLDSRESKSKMYYI